MRKSYPTALCLSVLRHAPPYSCLIRCSVNHYLRPVVPTRHKESYLRERSNLGSAMRGIPPYTVGWVPLLLLPAAAPVVRGAESVVRLHFRQVID